MPLLRAMARTAVIAGTANAVQHRQEERWAARDQAQYEAAMPAQAVAPAPAIPAPADDPMAKLAQLGELHASGVLTDEEFAAAKAKLLGL
jgi:Short C-terminal domain